MAPTSVYNLRGSKSVSTTGSPTKGKKSNNRGSSPVKKQRKLELGGGVDALPQIPESIVQALSDHGLPTLEDLRNLKIDELLNKILSSLPIPSSKNDMVRLESARLKREITAAWLRCLHALAQDPSTTLRSWQDWLDTRMMARLRHSQSLSRSLDKLPALTRGELIRQRQQLKKSKGPRHSRTITFAELRAAKDRLTVLPTGRALKGTVQPETLNLARSALKKPTNRN